VPAGPQAPLAPCGPAEFIHKHRGKSPQAIADLYHRATGNIIKPSRVARVLSHPPRRKLAREPITVPTKTLARNLQARDRNAAVRELRKAGATREQVQEIVKVKLGQYVKPSHIDRVVNVTVAQRGTNESASFKASIVDVARQAIADWQARGAGRPPLRHVYYQAAMAGLVPKDQEVGYRAALKALPAGLAQAKRRTCWSDTARRTPDRSVSPWRAPAAHQASASQAPPGSAS